MQTTVACGQCGHPLTVNARFCQNCGATITFPQASPFPATQQTYPLSNSPSINTEISKEERNWAMYCHLSAMLVYIIPYAHIFAPLILWLMKRDTSSFVNDQGKEALNYNFSIMIYMTIAALFSCFYIGIPFLVGLIIFDFIIMIIAGIRAGNGEYYRYPITIRFIK